MESKNKFVDGNIVKKDLTSHESWTVIDIEGKLMLQPNTSSRFLDTEIIPLDEEVGYIKLADIRGLNFGDIFEDKK